MKKLGKSESLQKKASRVLVGGVNSPVRSFKAVGGNPVFIKSAKGSRISDVDDNEYIDFVAAYGPLILGHADDDINKALADTLKKGTAFGSNSPLETDLAELVLQAYPGHDKIRFVNSGTEAVMSAVRLARGVTQKPMIIKFSGCYHGHMDDLLVAGGSGVATLGLPDSSGVTKQSAQNTIVISFNDIHGINQAFKKYAEGLAAVIIEPVAGNMGLVPADPQFLAEIRRLCDKHRALLISDEIMCGFRDSYKSVMSAFNVSADITCLGKIIGGGLPVGAYLARSEIMENLAPLGTVYQAGTLSGNPLAMAAGIATLKKIKRAAFYHELKQKTGLICQAAREKGFIANQFGSMFSLFFSDKTPQNFEDVQKSNTHLYGEFFWKILQKGLFVPPSPYETWFVSSAHSWLDIDKTVTILKECLN